MKSYSIALGGVTASLAVVVMCLGGYIPLATFVCPVICCIMLQFISFRLHKKLLWCWYCAVAIIALLLSPDKEAAFVFAFLGNYPLVRAQLPRGFWGVVIKLLYFNLACLTLYWILLHLIGLASVVEALGGMDVALTLLTLALGNITFFALDRLLGIMERKFQNGKR